MNITKMPSSKLELSKFYAILLNSGKNVFQNYIELIMLSQMTLESWHFTMWWWSSVGFPLKN